MDFELTEQQIMIRDLCDRIGREIVHFLRIVLEVVEFDVVFGQKFFHRRRRVEVEREVPRELVPFRHDRPHEAPDVRVEGIVHDIPGRVRVGLRHRC